MWAPTWPGAVNNNGWWGEGEIKFYLDGDSEYPTICGTGTEDYFCGSYNFEDPHTHQNYVDFNTPYGGLYAVGQDKLYKAQKRSACTGSTSRTPSGSRATCR